MRKASRVVLAEKLPLDRLARREGDRVHEDVELAPLALQPGEGRIDLLIDGHIERHQ